MLAYRCLEMDEKSSSGLLLPPELKRSCTIPAIFDANSGIYTMKELGRFVGYTLATLLMIGVVLAIAKADTDEGTLATAAIIIVVVLPVVVAIFMGRREKKNAEPS